MIALLAAALALPAWSAEISSAAVGDPHELVSTPAETGAGLAALTVYPEQLTYDVSWGLVSVGRATLGVRELVDFNGVPAYHVVSEARSNAFCDAFHKVRDLNESWIDARDLASLGYYKKLREGNFFRDEWVLYSRSSGTFLSKKINRDGSYEWSGGTVPAGVHDVLSSLYFVRSRPLEPGMEVVVDVNTKRTWPLVIKVLGRDTVKTKAGKFDCLVVEPFMREDGIFIQKGRKLQIWLTNDKRRIPVLMRVEVFFGHISARLTKML
ncbi:MAG: DUF3108 domain-containing protein [Elusimicrobia bacterium]|nr:DUF3108 domain-containing protein [Elusimicrobiota bacterium]